MACIVWFIYKMPYPFKLQHKFIGKNMIQCYLYINVAIDQVSLIKCLPLQARLKLLSLSYHGIIQWSHKYACDWSAINARVEWQNANNHIMVCSIQANFPQVGWCSNLSVHTKLAKKLYRYISDIYEEHISWVTTLHIHYLFMTVMPFVPNDKQYSIVRQLPYQVSCFLWLSYPALTTPNIMKLSYL